MERKKFRSNSEYIRDMAIEMEFASSKVYPNVNAADVRVGINNDERFASVDGKVASGRSRLGRFTKVSSPVRSFRAINTVHRILPKDTSALTAVTTRI